MFRVSTLTAWGWLALSPAAFAQSAPAAINACEGVERALARSEKELQGARTELERASATANSCQGELQQSKQRASQCAAQEASCQSDKQLQCQQTGQYLQQVADGHAASAAPGACVGGDVAARLVDQQRSAGAASSALAQLGAYSAGESDQWPLVGGGSSASDRLLAKVLGGRNGAKVYRRLLVEAVQRLAPTHWKKLKAQGPAAIEAWFVSNEPLPPEFVEEAKLDRSAQGERTEALLTTSLRLVQSYELLASCAPGDANKTCGRARQLRAMLESTGPLTVARRSEEIWSTDCSALSPQLVGGWLVDFPHDASSQSAQELIDALYNKTYACWLGTGARDESYSRYLSERLPAAATLSPRSLLRRSELEQRWQEGSLQDVCGRAALSMRGMSEPERCALDDATRDSVRGWAAAKAQGESASAQRFDAQLCEQLASKLWEGRAVGVPGTFSGTPAPGDLVQELPNRLASPMSALRTHCAARRGAMDELPEQLTELAALSRALTGESDPAWKLDAEGQSPRELSRYREAAALAPWLRSRLSGSTSCESLGLDGARCSECDALANGGAALPYDCALQQQLESRYARYRTLSWLAAGGLLALALLLVQGSRIWTARRKFGEWSERTLEHLRSLGLPARKSPWRWLRPSEESVLQVSLPQGSGWERHGQRALLVHSQSEGGLTEADVNRAGSLAAGERMKLALLVHPPQHSAELGAIRAALDWAARPGERAVHVLPLSSERFLWASRSVDLLEAVDDASTRGNPFEVRGRITSSSQFFNRERLVSALLSAVHAGKWTVVTGLRRMGKSSLTLEVARRAVGPAAYVDLTGFYHELEQGARSGAGEPGQATRSAVDAVLRQLCQSLLESARARYGELGALSVPEGGEVDSANVAAFFRALSQRIAEVSGLSAPPLLLVLDEIEQALGASLGPSASADGISLRAQAFAVLLGRLKSAVVDASAGTRQAPVGVLLGCAVHPILWAPLPSLAQQSIMGSFQSVCVPALPEDAAKQMMTSLGAWHGVRFAPAALDALLAASNRIPLLLRRLGASVLELYDVERANQGALGAVSVGEVGADEAIAREARPGSPVRVWVEAEIAPDGTPVGVVLRALARAQDGALDLPQLAALARTATLRSFEDAGFDRLLEREELLRRADEAAHVTLRLLGESGLLEPLGDLTNPSGYRLPDGIVRRTLAASSVGEIEGASATTEPAPLPGPKSTDDASARP